MFDIELTAIQNTVAIEELHEQDDTTDQAVILESESEFTSQAVTTVSVPFYNSICSDFDQWYSVRRIPCSWQATSPQTQLQGHRLKTIYKSQSFLFRQLDHWSQHVSMGSTWMSVIATFDYLSLFLRRRLASIDSPSRWGRGATESSTTSAHRTCGPPQPLRSKRAPSCGQGA